MDIQSFLQQYAKKQPVRLHMPGHKGRRLILGQTFAEFDITEIDGADNLLAPQGILRKMQRDASRFYSAAQSFALTGGATQGIHAMMLAYCQPGTRVLCVSDAHRSLHQALVLCGAHPIWLHPPLLSDGRKGAVTGQQIAEALAQNPDIVAVFCTSPDYLGYCGDAASWAAVCQQYQVALLIDEAHGAHFSMAQGLPVSAVKLGASAVVQSAHKTLNSPTQTAWLHCVHKKDAEKLSRALLAIQSSSPSYPLLLAMDDCRKQMQQDAGGSYAPLIEVCQKINEQWESAGLLPRDLPPGVIVKDPTRLICRLQKKQISAEQAAKMLHQQGYIVEAAIGEFLVAIATPQDDLSALASYGTAVMDLPQGQSFMAPVLPIPPVGKAVLSPREAFFAPQKALPVALAIGKICAQSAGAVPPGIPAIFAGHLISAQAAEYLAQLPKTAAFGMTKQGHVWVVA